MLRYTAEMHAEVQRSSMTLSNNRDPESDAMHYVPCSDSLQTLVFRVSDKDAKATQHGPHEGVGREYLKHGMSFGSVAPRARFRDQEQVQPHRKKLPIKNLSRDSIAQTHGRF